MAELTKRVCLPFFVLRKRAEQITSFHRTDSNNLEQVAPVTFFCFWASILMQEIDDKSCFFMHEPFPNGVSISSFPHHRQNQLDRHRCQLLDGTGLQSVLDFYPGLVLQPWLP